MKTQFKVYLYGFIAFILLSITSYIVYVFNDRAETKEMITQQERELETKDTEIDAKAIAAKAQGKIEQIEEGTYNEEADTSHGVHSYTF